MEGALIPERVLTVLRAAGPRLAGRDFYLGGGTALAMQLGHRESIDLHFFRQAPFDQEALARALDLGAPLPAERGTLRWVMDGVKVECFHYPYPLVAPLRDIPGVAEVRMADVLDLGLMKLVAIGQRGSKKDFVDLYAIDRQRVPLAGLLRHARSKFGPRFNLFHHVKALAYFEDADREPDPLGWRGPPWPEIKRHFARRAAELAGTMLER